jgi:hypothetical protein
MTATPMAAEMSPQLLKVRERAKRDPQAVFLSLAHLIDEGALARAFPSLKTRTARLRRAITAVADWCRRHRHLAVKEQHAALTRRLTGHYNYFAVNGNSRSLAKLYYEADVPGTSGFVGGASGHISTGTASPPCCGSTRYLA